MNIKNALTILTEELIESHVRCHYPYVMTSGACTIGTPPTVAAGVSIQIHSDVFGPIASASAPTWERALLGICGALINTRDTRWVKESRRTKS